MNNPTTSTLLNRSDLNKVITVLPDNINRK